MTLYHLFDKISTNSTLDMHPKKLKVETEAGIFVYLKHCSQ